MGACEVLEDYVGVAGQELDFEGLCGEGVAEDAAVEGVGHTDYLQDLVAAEGFVYEPALHTAAVGQHHSLNNLVIRPIHLTYGILRGEPPGKRHPDTIPSRIPLRQPKPKLIRPPLPHHNTRQRRHRRRHKVLNGRLREYDLTELLVTVNDDIIVTHTDSEEGAHVVGAGVLGRGDDGVVVLDADGAQGQDDLFAGVRKKGTR